MTSDADVIEAAWGKPALEAIEKVLAEAAPGALVLFDFDNTLIHGDLGDEALLTLLSGHTIVRPPVWGPLSPAARVALEAAFGENEAVAVGAPGRKALEGLLRHVLLKESLPGGEAAFMPHVTAHCRGSYFAMAALIEALAPEVRTTLAIEAWERGCAATEPSRSLRPREAMLALRSHAERAGLAAWVVTASHEDVVRAVAPRLGVLPERVIGARVARSLAAWPERAGAPVMTFDEGKRAHVAHHIEGLPIAQALELTTEPTVEPTRARRPRVAIACGDADTDHAMLEDASGAIVLVERGQPRVSALAQAREQAGRVAVVRVAPDAR